MELIDRVISQFQENEAIELTRALIRIPSIFGDEGAMADYLSQELIKLRLPVECIEAKKGRPNLISSIKGQTDDVGLILVGHIDTVPPDQGSDEPWGFDPFGGELRNGCIYGLGSADMKGGIAAILSAFKAVLNAEVKLKKGLTIVFCADEEGGSIEGMKYIAERKMVKGSLAMAADTTNMCIQGWFKGRTIYEIETRGKTAHPSNPTKGINAINHMADIIHKINHVGFPHAKHEFLGGCTINFGSVQGGKDIKSIPEQCKATLEVRTVPGQTGEGVREQINAYISEMKKMDPSLVASVKIMSGKDPMELSARDPIFDVIQKASQKAIGKKLQLGKAGIGGGDLYFLWKNMGIPGINFGPGDVELAHSPNEYVKIDNIVAVSKCYTAFIVEFCEGYIEKF